MPRKYDPDCPLCVALRTGQMPDHVLLVAKMGRSSLFLDADGPVAIVAAHEHVTTVQDMHPAQRQLFEQDSARVTTALAQVSGGMTRQTELAENHLQIMISAPLMGDPAQMVGDLREALGYIREPITDPNLVDWVDDQGRVRDWPSQRHEAAQMAVRVYLASRFEVGRAYTEKEVNAVLNTWATFGDWALLRRELFMYGFLRRYKDGSRYWIAEKALQS